MGSATDDIAQAAARLVVDEGLEYGAAKRKAARDLSRRHGRRTELPSNEAVEDEVRDYLALFCADTQPAELLALRAAGAALDASAWRRSDRTWPARSGAAPPRAGRRCTSTCIATTRRPPRSR